MVISNLTSPQNLPVPLGLLPAIHDASVDEISLVADFDPIAKKIAGSVYKNATGTSIALPAYAKWPSLLLKDGDYFGCDGRFFYKVVNKPGTTSYYPNAFERTIYQIPFSKRTFPIEKEFTLVKYFVVRMFSNNTPCVWSVVFEIGTRADDTGPGAVGPNIKGFTYRTPMLDSQIFISDILSEHSLGISIHNEGSVTALTNAFGFSGSAYQYDKSSSAPLASLPVSDEFMLRVKLCQFDTINDVRDPKGYVAYVLSDASVLPKR